MMSECENRCDQGQKLEATLQLERQSLTAKNEQLTTEISFLKAELEALRSSSNVKQQVAEGVKQQQDTRAPILWV